MQKKNILFLTLGEINSVEERGIYTDLLRKFRDEGHSVTVMTPVERRRNIATNLRKDHGVDILQVKTFNIQKTNVIEKGVGTLAIEYQYLNAVKKYLKNSRFDLVLYSTPPITFEKVISFVKNRDNASTYLLLKDIFPQNAVDMKMLKEGSFIHNYFRKKEKALYKISDNIGCMSPANVDFVLKHNPEILPGKVEENPNTISPAVFDYSQDQKNEIRKKYSIPTDKKAFIYGGNLGKPQGVDFLLECIAATSSQEVHFVIVGSGTEYPKIQKWFDENKPKNAQLFEKLPKADYDRLLAAGDVGLIFLHKDFLIPNFPSRLLNYLEMKMPVIAATDGNTDIGDIIEDFRCGYKVSAGNIEEMKTAVDKILQADLRVLGENSWKLLQEKYLVQRSYDLIMSKLNA